MLLHRYAASSQRRAGVESVAFIKKLSEIWSKTAKTPSGEAYADEASEAMQRQEHGFWQASCFAEYRQLRIINLVHIVVKIPTKKCQADDCQTWHYP